MPVLFLPARWHPPARRLRNFLLTDATALLILGIGILFRGLSYAPGVLGPAPQGGSHPAEVMLPINAWAAVWIISGVACVVAAFTKSPVVDAVALGLGVALNIAWGASFIAATIIGDSARGWVSAVGYFSIAALVLWAVWRGKRGDVDLESEATWTRERS